MKKEGLRPFSVNKTPLVGVRIRRLFDLQVNSVYLSIKKFLKNMKGSVLEVGCGNQPYRFLLPKNCNYYAIEYENAESEFSYHFPGVIYYDGKHFPCEHNSYDNIFHTEVVEHVKNPNIFFKECYRVLKNGGAMLFSMPFSARYHYIPNDYWRFTPTSLEILLKDAGFDDISIVPRSTDICVAAYKALTIGYRLFFSRHPLKMIAAILFAPFWLLSLLVGQISLITHVGSPDDCLGYTVTCKKQ